MTSLTTSGWQLLKFKNGRTCRIRRLRCCISREPFELESPKFTGTSIPNRPTYAPEMTSLASSVRTLPRKKTVANATSDGFGSTFSDAAFFLTHQLVGFWDSCLLLYIYIFIFIRLQKERRVQTTRSSPQW